MVYGHIFTFIISGSFLPFDQNTFSRFHCYQCKGCNNNARIVVFLIFACMFNRNMTRKITCAYHHDHAMFPVFLHTHI